MPSALDIDSLYLDRGAHSPGAAMSVMEAVAYVAGEKWSDSPVCVSPVLAAYLRSLNDTMTDAQRQALKPLILLCVNSNTGAADDQKRSLLALDWLVREYTPAWMALAKLDTEAKALSALPAIDSWDRLAEANTLLQAAQQRAASAWTAAGNAWDAVRDAAWGAAGASAKPIAAAPAFDAARTAAGAAAMAVLAPTVLAVQASAIELAKRMAAVGR